MIEKILTYIITTPAVATLLAACIAAAIAIWLHSRQRKLEIKKESILQYAEAVAEYRTKMTLFLLLSKSEPLLSCGYYQEMLKSTVKYNRKIDRVYLTCSDKACEEIEIVHMKMVVKQMLISDAVNNFKNIKDRISELDRREENSFLSEFNNLRLNLIEILGKELSNKEMKKTKIQVRKSFSIMATEKAAIDSRNIERLGL